MCFLLVLPTRIELYRYYDSQPLKSMFFYVRGHPTSARPRVSPNRAMRAVRMFLCCGVDEHRVLCDHIEGVFACHHQQIEIVDDICDFQIGQAVLARAEKFARPADAQVVIGDLKAVVAAGHHFKPAFGDLVFRFGKQAGNMNCSPRCRCGREADEAGQGRSGRPPR